jgi:molybdenum cofactor cytidylyltransferase
VHRAVRAAFECGAKFVVLVTGARRDEVSSAVSDFETLVFTNNSEWESGLASSLRAGLDAAEAHRPFDGVLVTLADQPLVDAASLKKLIAPFDREHRIIASRYAGTIGVPVLIGAEYLSELMDLEGDRGAGPWLRAHRDNLTSIEMPGAAVDVDTPEDFLPFKRASKEE